MPKVQLEGSWVYQGILYSPDEAGEADVPKEAQEAIKSKGGKVKTAKVEKPSTEAGEQPMESPKKKQAEEEE